MLRSSRIKPVRPNSKDWHVNEFESVELVKEEVPVYDKKGNVIRTESVTKRVFKPYDKDMIEHKGISCDLFTLENQINAGVNLKSFNGSFITPDLSESSALGEEAIAKMNELVQNQNNVEQDNNE